MGFRCLEAFAHQITAVYGEMLPRQPLRFLLVDDPGAGKTIMAGLLIKELLIHGETHPAVAMAIRAVADGKRSPEAIARPRRQMEWSHAALAVEQYVAEASRERPSAATRGAGVHLLG